MGETVKHNNIMTSYLIVTGIVILIITALNLIKSGPNKKLRKTKSDLSGKPKLLDGILRAMSLLNEGGTDLDTIPEGYGEFGYEVTNPIPVNTVLGNMAYLRRLRTLNGKEVQVTRLGSTWAPIIEKPINNYEISVEGEKIASLFLSPYHKKNSIRSPKGFKLIQ